MMPLKKESETIGEKIKKKRAELKLSLEEVAREIQAPVKYIRALEEDDYALFSAKVYALGFFKKLLETLAFEDKEGILKEFNNEWEIKMFRKDKVATPLPENRGKEPHFTPKRMWLLGGGILLLFFLVFLGSRFIDFVGSPEINLTEPQDQITLSEPLVRVRGNTEKEGHLTVNGREITIDENGNFNQEIELLPGLNALEFIVKNKFNKESKVVRYIFVK